MKKFIRFIREKKLEIKYILQKYIPFKNKVIIYPDRGYYTPVNEEFILIADSEVEQENNT